MYEREISQGFHTLRGSTAKGGFYPLYQAQCDGLAANLAALRCFCYATRSMGHTRGNDSSNHGWVTTGVAAAALGIKPRQCRNLIQEGELEAKLEGKGRDKRYLVSVSSLEALRDKRQSGGKLPLNRRVAEDEDVGAELGQWMRELTARLETRAAENAELRTRLELTEKADSTLREQLERERERADRLEERAEKLRGELEAERSKGFWARLFGG